MDHVPAWNHIWQTLAKSFCKNSAFLQEQMVRLLDIRYQKTNGIERWFQTTFGHLKRAHCLSEEDHSQHVGQIVWFVQWFGGIRILLVFNSPREYPHTVCCQYCTRLRSSCTVKLLCLLKSSTSSESGFCRHWSVQHFEKGRGRVGGNHSGLQAIGKDLIPMCRYSMNAFKIVW